MLDDYNIKGYKTLKKKTKKKEENLMVKLPKEQCRELKEEVAD